MSDVGGHEVAGGKVLPPGAGHQSAVMRMGNDIVRQYAHWADREAAAEEIATHIKKFWEPRMRHELMAHVRLGDTEMPFLLGMAAAHLVDGDIDRQELKAPSGG